MSTELSPLKKLLAPIIFNRKNLAIIGTDENSSGLAIAIFLINAVIAIYFMGWTLIYDAAGLVVVIILFITSLLHNILRLFGSQATIWGAFRILSFSSTWFMIGILIWQVGGKGDIVLVTIWLFMIAYVVGISSLSQIGWTRVLVSIAITLILFTFVLFLFLAVTGFGAW
ncbi:MAG: hypothetical protein ACXAD7_13235 [Candidatus Kariarchaeaceae archaeon]